MEKTKEQWIEEASTFEFMFELYSGRKPTLEDVIGECRFNDEIEDAETYATKLFEYISKPQ